VGDRVRLRSLDTRGVISALGEEEAEVRVGNLRVRSRRADLELLGGPPKESQREREESSQASSKEAAPTSVVSRSSAPGMELDLRGKRVDEALEAVDRYLDSAYLSGLPYVRLIHGKGTGRLREAVRQELRGHPHVTTFESGLPNEGGDGVTVARLKKT
jgi:DNA mismatch repair protein MutS2